MQTSNTLALMQSVATLALMLSLSFAYLINPLEDSIFFSVLSSFSKSLYNSNVINELNTSVIAGIITGLFCLCRSDFQGTQMNKFILYWGLFLVLCYF